MSVAASRVDAHVLHDRDRSWSPQPGPQDDLCCCPFPEVFFGGARGGGKTDGVLGKWALKDRRYGSHFNAIMFRRTSVSAEDAIERSKEIYTPLGGRYIAGKGWRMPNGGRVAFKYLEKPEDAKEYQGRNITDAWVEEAGQYASSAAIDLLFGVLRSAHGVPVQLILTANPGGAGQHWIRDRYQLHPFPRQPKVLRRKLPNGAEHCIAVIPSRITDNRILLNSDPGYVSRLYLVGSAQLVKAWLEGDWTAIEGAFFAEWSNEQHVLTPFAIPDHWLRFRSGDWGSYSPFSIGWWAVVGDDFRLGDMDTRGAGVAIPSDDGRVARNYLPRGAIVRYREWYGTKGAKLFAEEVGRGIASRERDDRAKLTYGVLDPSAFNEDGGPSNAERINDVLLAAKISAFTAADNSRVTRVTGDRDKAGPMGGWDVMRSRIVGTAKRSKDGIVNWSTGRPMLYVFSTCTDLIRTLPVAQHDQNRAEDLDCWVAGTMISTPRGDRAIETIKAGEIVDTPIGPRIVTHSYLSGSGETAWAELSNGRRLEGTPRHKIYIKGKGLIALGNVECYDIPIQRIMSWQRRVLFIAVSLTRGMKVAFTTIRTARSWSAAGRAFIARCGSMTGASFLPGGTSTTRMATTTTMNSIISSVYRLESTADYTSNSGSLENSENNWRRGEPVMMGKIPFEITPERCERERRRYVLRAEIAESLLLRDIIESFIVRTCAPLRRVANKFVKHVRSAVPSFGPVDIERKKSEPVHIVAVGRCDVETPVFNLTIEKAGLFYANGFLSSNTDSEDHAIDETRYACLSRPWVKPLPKDDAVKRDAYQESNDDRYSDSTATL